jgi:CHAD domain-containing protein
MVFVLTEPQITSEEKVGFAYWADRVLEEHSNVGGALPAEPIHDLRISLRRCILIAEVMRDLDPTCDWKAMRKSARRTFQRLGTLRDTQILTEWVEKLGTLGEVSTDLLLDALKKKHEQDRIEARAAIREFDRKQWRGWRREFAKHYRHVASNRAACESLLVEILEHVSELNRLRVGLKKFRYAVENFLPQIYPGWAPDLKMLQDFLGEIHDLTVLDQMIVKSRSLFDEAAFTAWREKLNSERSSRLQQYRAKVTGAMSPLRIWRESFPAEKDLRTTGLARLAELASFVTPDFPSINRIARLSLQLYDGLASRGPAERESQFDERSVLHAAALMQEAGRFKRSKAYHKESYRMIRKLSPPPGWTKRDLEFAALVARFHRRALPYPDHEKLRVYELPLRQSLIRLAAILRLANAFQAKAYRAIRRLHVENGPAYVAIRAEGISDGDGIHSKLSVARRFLEFVLQRTVYILAPGARVLAPHIVKPATRSDAA